MDDPVITDLRRVEAQPSPRGTVVVARFTCRVGGVALLGMKLLQRPDRAFAVSNVTAGGGTGRAPRGAVIEDEGLRASILAAAVAALDGDPAPVAGAGLRRFLGPSAGNRHRGPRRQG